MAIIALVAQAVRSDSSVAEDAAGERYLFLADISGHSRFMAGVEEEHGVDLSDGIPAAYSTLGDLLGAIVDAVKRDLALVKLEGDAVFAAAQRAALMARAIVSSGRSTGRTGRSSKPEPGRFPRATTSASRVPLSRSST
jgi:hypothetical protein